MKFIHLTDTHLTEPGVVLYGLDPQARLRAAVDSINTECGDARFVVITGDLTHWGQPAAYEALKTELARLAMPAHLLIGNHDERRSFCFAFPNTPQDANNFIQYAFTVDDRRFVVLDTNEPGVSWGVFCEKRSAWLHTELASHDLPVYLFIHHPPFPVGINAMDHIGLRDPSHLRSALSPHLTRIRHLFFGHLHRPISGSWLGVPVSTLRGTNHQVALDWSATVAVPGSHEPPQYAVVLTHDEHTIIHLHDYLDESPRFDL